MNNNTITESNNKTQSFFCSGFNYRNVILLSSFLVCLSNPANAQDTDLDFALMNIGVSSIIGGVGAVINKGKEEEFGKVFLKGVAQGALGGYVIFESKRMLREFSKTGKYVYVWPSKIVNAAGNSIIENAASNQNFWIQWHLNIGFNRFDIYTKDKIKFRYRIMPFGLYSTIQFLSRYSFNLTESAKLGTLVFETDKIIIEGNDQINAGTKVNLILLEPSTSITSKSHELVHVYQYEQFSGFNSFFKKPSKQLEAKSKIYRFYSKYFYTDWNSPIRTILYNIKPQFHENLFEKESEYIEY